MTDEQIAREEAMDELARELEKKHTKPRLTTQELKSIFPEILEIAPFKCRQIESRIRELEKYYNKHKLTGDSLEVLWEQDRREEQIRKLKKQLARFKRFLPEEQNSFGMSEAQIQEAMEVPILDLVDSPRRFGNAYKILCPLHEERTPSCHIYLKDNSFWCFGCNRGGNTINLIMARDDVDFPTAVRQLIGAVS